MRLYWLALALSIGGMLPAQQDPETVRQLVEEGALPRKKLAELEEISREESDKAVLARYLYGESTIEELSEGQGGELVEAAERLRERQVRRLAEGKRIVEEGAAPRNSLDELEMELVRREQTLELARARKKLLEELAEMARNEQEAEEEARPEPITLAGSSRAPAVRFDGDGDFAQDDWRSIVLAFEKQFGRPVPVSARGDTRLHRSLGLDHRGRIDVALNPDQEEGVWLRRYLESEKIPYFAFRRRLPGKATAPHIHIGPPSPRIRAAY
jgi:hypothetical protein